MESHSKERNEKSKYLAPVPHWNLDNHFDKNVKIGFLTNGNMSSRLFTLNKETIGLRNTSTFDALAQVYLDSNRHRFVYYSFIKVMLLYRFLLHSTHIYLHPEALLRVRVTKSTRSQ